MKRYVYEIDGSYAFLSDDANEITPDAIEITEEQYQEALEQISNGLKITDVSNGQLIFGSAAEPMNMDILRIIRRKKLKATDWTQSSDLPDQLKAQWAAYRQELRDLPETYAEGFENFEWPQAPDSR